MIQVRSGSTATPGTGWTAWATVNASSNSITRNARYLQYRRPDDEYRDQICQSDHAQR